MEKKATDVLAEILEKVEFLTKLVQSNDHSQKIILDRLNRLVIANSSTQQISTTNQLPLPASKKVEPQKQVEQFREEVVKNASFTKNQQKITVVQKVVDYENRDVFMAEVIIYDQIDNIVEKTKTSAVGKWSAELVPGKYKAIYNKNDLSLKKVLTKTSMFFISPGTDAIKLDDVVLQK